MSDTPDQARALRFMVEEMRAEPTPDIAWDDLEQKLLSRIARNEEPRYVPRASAPSSFARVASFAVAAAVLALGIGLGGMSGDRRAAMGETPDTARAVTPVAIESVALAGGEAGVRGDHDLLALRVGDAIETGAEPATFVQAGSVRWTLAPSSRAIIRARGVGGVGHVVALERGSIQAEVTPRDPSEGLVEAFAVEAGGTRVAVHGTLFSVTLAANEVVVDVEHGAVAVGPVGHVGMTTGHLLVGPARASFSLDGGRLARRLSRWGHPTPQARATAMPVAALDAPASPAADDAVRGEADESAATPAHPSRQVAVSAPVAAHPAAAPGQAPAAEPAVEAPVAPAVPPAPQFLTESVIRSELAQCFRQTHPAGVSEAVKSASWTFVLSVRADGSIQSGKFDPPADNDFTNCAGKLLGRSFESGPARKVIVSVSFGK